MSQLPWFERAQNGRVSCFGGHFSHLGSVGCEVMAVPPSGVVPCFSMRTPLCTWSLNTHSSWIPFPGPNPNVVPPSGRSCVSNLHDPSEHAAMKAE
jgi:hypothetical protein